MVVPSRQYNIVNEFQPYEAILKEYYENMTPENMTYKKHPLLAMLEKNPNLQGKTFPLPIQYGNPQGTSNTFTNAKANQSRNRYDKFNLYTTFKYSFATLERLMFKAAKSDIGSFVKEATKIIDNSIITHMQQLQADLYGDGSGSIGQVGSIAGQVITLSAVEDWFKFSKDQTLVFCATRTGGTVSNKVTVSARGTSKSGQITVAGSLAGVQPNWFIFRDGDYGNALTGLSGYIPEAAPVAGDNFFGMDRSNDVEMLSGVRLDAQGSNIIEGLMELASMIEAVEGEPDFVFMNHLDITDVEKQLTNKIEYTTVDLTLSSGVPIAFKGIKLPTHRGEVTIIADPYQKRRRAHMLTLKSWELASIDKIANMIDDDGVSMLRASDQDAFEVRIASYPQLACYAPGHNGVFTW
jgi:hypothetical protein